MGLKYGWYGSLLVKATQKLHDLALHLIYDDTYHFYVDVPGEEHPLLGVILGNGGQMYGLNLFPGPGALEAYEVIQMAGSNAGLSRIAMKHGIYGYNMEPRDALDPEAKKWLKQANVRLSPREVYPDFLLINPGKTPRMPNDRDVRRLLYAVNAIIRSHEDGTFAPGDFPEAGIFTLVVTGEPEDPAVTTETRYLNSAAPSPAAAPPEVDKAIVFRLGSLPRTQQRWHVAAEMLPAFIQDDDRQPVGLFVFEESGGPIWANVAMESDARSLWENLCEFMLGEAPTPPNTPTPPHEPGLPEVIFFTDDDLREYAAEALSPLGIPCETEPRPEVIQGLLDEMFDNLDAPASIEAVAKMWGDNLPPADMLDAWLDVDAAINMKILEGLAHDERFLGDRAINRYFGRDADQAVDALLEGDENAAAMAYGEWFVLDYRSTRKSPTLAERWLEDEDMPAAVKTLLQARMNAAPALYDVAVVDAEAWTLSFKDIDSGEVTVIADYDLFNAQMGGMLVPARIYPAGDFHFVSLAGPPHSRRLRSRAIEIISGKGSAEDDGSQKAASHMFGRLWL